MGFEPAKLHAGIPADRSPFIPPPAAVPADFAAHDSPLRPEITITGQRALPMQEDVEAALSRTADAFASISGWQYGLNHMGFAHMPEAELRAVQAALDAASDRVTALRAALYPPARCRVPLSAEDLA